MPHASPSPLSHHNLGGRAALLTGAAAGVGLAIARAFLGAGAKVTVVDLDLGALARAEEALQAAGNALFLEADVAEAGAPARCFEAAEGALGPVDTLVNNAGIAGPIGPLEGIDPAGWRQTLEVNLTAPALWAAEFLRRLPPGEEGGERGCIINLASTAGKRPLIHRTPYCASKAGVIGFTRSLAAELGSQGVRVNAICPGPVRGERIERVLAARARSHGRTLEEERARTLSSIPLRTFVEADAVAAAAIYLASEAACHVTGEDMNVTAGNVMH